MTYPRRASELLMVCWCDLHMAPTTPEAVKAGQGWSCSPQCQPGCAPGAGRKPSGPPTRTPQEPRR